MKKKLWEQHNLPSHVQELELSYQSKITHLGDVILNLTENLASDYFCTKPWRRGPPPPHPRGLDPSAVAGVVVAVAAAVGPGNPRNRRDLGRSRTWAGVPHLMEALK